MYDIFDEEYIQNARERESHMEGIDAMVANLRKIGINEDAIQNAAEMSRKQFKLS